MNLLALLFGLFTERFLTHLFHLREARWLDGFFDLGLRQIGRGRGFGAALVALLIVLVPVLPVLALQWFARDVLYSVPYFLFSVVVLMFSLGPRDLEEEVDEFEAAITADDRERAGNIAKELLESDPPRGGMQRQLAIEEAIFVQSNNRLFGVVLWFMLLGPAGAWAFRVSDMFRRRAIFESARLEENQQDPAISSHAAQQVHGMVAWLPARLVALAFALAGSFETAVQDWRSYYNNCADHFFEVNDDVVACAGLGALGGAVTEDEGAPEALAARSAMRLVSRALWVWLTAIAALTVVGLAV
ncbi:MAG: regulatory signaling modulator protein AmpE [Gammaproteobacteria bacterium]|nr:regulatory signaling modulator protein AmpE [Gammaproteobacteria bacterium]NND58850.1 regulatory signaling modulator protein AmpE [Gammaproteobacteria bacterium]